MLKRRWSRVCTGAGHSSGHEQAPERAQVVDQGQVVAQFWSGEGPVKVPNGLIHDWIAAAFIRDSNIRELLAVMQEYDKHKNTYKPEVIDSKLISHDGNDFQVYLRLLKKENHYSCPRY
jgi:hypothetical protein